MIDTLLALVPTYGLWLILGSVILSCLALPIPSSMLVMAAGGFAAAGDFAYWSLVVYAYLGFVIGDQLAFWLARYAGSPFINRLKAKPKPAKIIATAENLIRRRGNFAVILSRTVLSPVGPYVTYISGALRYRWFNFTAAAAFGALLWCLGYSWLGYAFASRIDDIAAMISSSVGIIMAGTILAGGVYWLVRSYRNDQKDKTP